MAIVPRRNLGVIHLICALRLIFDDKPQLPPIVQTLPSNGGFDSLNCGM